jgi:RNA polymerase sigma-70 factor (ECF subfamily)
MEPGEHPHDCKQLFALLSEYLDAELNPQSCEEIRAHLAACPPCVEFLESLKRTVRLCHDCEPAEAPPPLSPETREQLLAAYQKTIGGRS